MQSDNSKTIRPIDKPHYRYWQALIYAFFSEKLYIDVGKRWKGYGLGYLLFLVFILTIPYTILMIIQFELYFKENIAGPFDRLPPIVIQNGEVKSDKPQPILVKNSANKTMIIVDNSGNTTNFSSKYPDAFLLITKNKIFFRNPRLPSFFVMKDAEDKIKEVPIQKDLNQIFSGSQWADSFNLLSARIFFDFILYPIIAGVIFFLYFVLFIAVAFIAQLMAKTILKYELTYKQTFRLLTVGATPQIFLLIVFLSLKIIFAGFGLILLSILAFYFCYGVLSLKRYSKKLVLK